MPFAIPITWMLLTAALINAVVQTFACLSITDDSTIGEMEVVDA